METVFKLFVCDENDREKTVKYLDLTVKALYSLQIKLFRFTSSSAFECNE